MTVASEQMNTLYRIIGIIHSHIMVADVTLGAFSRCTARTMYPTLIDGIIQSHTTPVMVGYIIAFPGKCRPTRPPRTLLGRLSRDKPCSMPELRVALGVGEALHALVEAIAFLATAGWAVLARLAVGVVPLPATKVFVVRSIGECIRKIACPK